MAIAFRKAVEHRDLEAAVATLAPDVILHSPVSFTPTRGKPAVTALFSILLNAFEDFRYVAQFEGAAGTVLHFRTRIGDREVEGIDMIHTNAEGLIDDFTVMVRPLSAALALRDTVGRQLAQPTS
jgi:limonene-1,2-epoxide hydrolase